MSLVLAAAALGLTFWLYPSQTRGLSSRWQVALPVLRVMAVLGLAISLLKPTLVRPRTEGEEGAIVLLVDGSASMGIADVQMSAAQKVPLADGLRLLPEGKRQPGTSGVLRRVADLRGDLDQCARGLADLEYASLSGRQTSQRENELERVFTQACADAVELDRALANAALDGELRSGLKVLEETPAEPRRAGWVKEVAAALVPLEAMLQKQQEQADAALYQADADVRRVADSAAGQSRLRLTEQAITGEKGLLAALPADVPLYGFSFAEGVRPVPLRSGVQNVKRLTVEAEGAQSRLSEAVASALDQLRGRAVRGIVVFSDGRAVGDSAAVQGVLSNTPVYAVQCGKSGASKDLAMASVAMPSAAYTGETINVKVGLKASNMPAGERDLVLKAGDEQQVRKVKLDANGSGEAEFQLKVDRPGAQDVEVSVKPEEGEATAENNKALRRVKVIQDKLTVMLLASAPTWEYQYVRNALTRTKWVRLSDVLLDDPKAQLGLDPERIARQNVIVLVGLRPGALTAQQADALHRAVTQRGASVILAAGELADLEGYGRNVLLSELLPYRAGGRPAWRDWPGDRPAFRMVPARGSEALDVVRLGEDVRDSTARWNMLPAVYHYLALPQLKPNVLRTLLVEKDSQLPVLLESRLGIGRVLFLGLRESWRWRMRVAERDQDRFWLQLVRYSGEEPYTLVSDDLAMDVERVAIRPGDAVRVRARVSASLGQVPTVELLQQAKVVRTERPTAASQGQPGRYEATLRDIPAGDYDVAVRLPGRDASAMRMPLHVAYAMDQELANIEPDEAAMKQLAEGTGGQHVSAEQAGNLAAKLRQLRHRSGSTVEIPLWTSGYLFLFALACLSMEWAIRKRAGLA